MHTLKGVLAFLLVAVAIQMQAQEKVKKAPIQLSAISVLDVGDPIRYAPGMFVDYGIRLTGSSKERTRYNARGLSSQTKDRDLYLKPFLGFYKREDYHTALMLGTEFTFRATSPGGFFWDANVGAGYMHLFFNAPVYVYENGSFEEKKLQGYANVIAKGSVNFGYDLSKSGKLPLGIYTGLGFMFRYPNNSIWVRSPYFQLGAMYTLKKTKS